MNTVPPTVAWKLQKQMTAAGLRIGVDERSASIGAKIKDARNERIQYLLVMGDQEQANGTCSVRSRREDQLGEMTPEAVIAKISDDVEKRI